MTEQNIGRIHDGSGDFGEPVDKKPTDSLKEGHTPGQERRSLFIGNSLGSSVHLSRSYDVTDFPPLRIPRDKELIIPDERDSWPILSTSLRRYADFETRFNSSRDGSTAFRRREPEMVDPDFKAQLAQEYPDLPEIAINRAASNPEWFAPIILRNYRVISKRVSDLSADERNSDIPRDILIEAAYRGESPRHIIELHDYFLQKAKMRENTEKKGFQVEGVPTIKQRHVNWCGYSSLSMILQHNGYSDLTPESLFKHEFGEYDGILERVDPSQGPSIDTLALIAQELKPLKPRILGTKEYNALRESNPIFDKPQDVLKTFLKKNVPAIIRLPSHFIVVTGYDPESNRYTVNDPARGYEVTVRADTLESAWGAREYYPRDPRYLMMLFPPLRKNTMEGAKQNAA